MKIQNIIAHPTNEQKINAIKAFLKALKIKFDVAKDYPYNSDFEQKVIESRKEAVNGKVTRVEKGNLKDFLGL